MQTLFKGKLRQSVRHFQPSKRRQEWRAIGLHLTAHNLSSPCNCRKQKKRQMNAILQESALTVSCSRMHTCPTLFPSSFTSPPLLYSFIPLSLPVPCLLPLFLSLFFKIFFPNPSPLLCMTSVCISPMLPGATWMEKDKWICWELRAGGTKERKKEQTCRTRLWTANTLDQLVCMTFHRL